MSLIFYLAKLFGPLRIGEIPREYYWRCFWTALAWGLFFALALGLLIGGLAL